MKQRFPLGLLGAAALSACAGIVASPMAVAAPTGTASAPNAVQKKQQRIAAYIDSLPQYVSMETINHIRNLRGTTPPPYLQPFLDGKYLPPSMASLPGVTPALVADQFDGIPTPPDGAGRESGDARKPLLLAQAPDAIAPSPVPAQGPAGATDAGLPHWVRYPLEFQLCGIALGTHAVDKVQGDRIDRYGLFAMHGNPTAVVVPAVGGGGVTVSQEPPEVASLFGGDNNGFLPAWASAITVQLDNNHVEWLYKRDTYAMGFVVDRLGFVDAIVVAGTYSPIARTQMEDRYHTVQLGDDLRKVLYRYGYPDTIETYEVSPVAGVGTQTSTGGGAAAGAGAGAAGGLPGGGAAAPAGAGGAGGAAAPAAASAGPSNGAYRTFEFRYEQSYNVVFSIRDNRVVRIYIFGDPDFFNMARRSQLRNSY